MASRRNSTADLWRLRAAQVWLALLSLASFRSPFVPDADGLIGTLWLLTLIAAEHHRFVVTWVRAVAVVAFSLVLTGGLTAGSLFGRGSDGASRALAFRPDPRGRLCWRSAVRAVRLMVRLREAGRRLKPGSRRNRGPSRR